MPDIKTVQTACLLFLSFSALCLLLWATRAVMVPFLVGTFLHLAVTPLATRLERSLKIPRFLSWIITVLIALALAGLIILALLGSFQGLVKSMESYRTRLIQLARDGVVWFNSLLEPTGQQLDAAALVAFVSGLPYLSYAQAVSSGIFGFFGQAFLSLMFFIFLVAGSGAARRRSRANPSAWLEATVASYVSRKFLISLATGALTALALFILRVDMALLFGLFAFLLNFIPNVGSPIAMLLPLPVAFFQYGLGLRLVLAFILPWIVQTILAPSSSRGSWASPWACIRSPSSWPSSSSASLGHTGHDHGRPPDGRHQEPLGPLGADAAGRARSGGPLDGAS
jgi:AI-2 transport protein TqsA